MDRIRLRFTGITAYSTTLATTLTGFIFMLLITRRLTPEELGVWRYIGTLITYFIIPANLLSFWATRFTAAGEKLLTTLLTITATASALATLAFITSANIFASPVNFPTSIFIAAALEIPSIYLYTVLEAVSYAKKPHVNYYAQLVQEILKIPVAAALVIIMRLGLLGAIIATIAAYIARAATVAFYIKDLEWGKLSAKTAAKMASVMWLPLYQSGAGVILALDTVIVTILTGSAPVGYAAAVFLLGSMITATGTLAAGLYPKMLQHPSGKDIEAALSLVLMLAIPSSIGVIILGAPLLNILRPEYSAAAQVLPIAIIHACAFVMSSIMDAVIAGSERADFNNISFKNLLRSKLFLLPTLNYLNAAVYIPTLYVAVILLNPANPLNVLTIWFTLNLAIFIVFTLYKTLVAYRSVKFSFPVKPVINYSTAAAVMAIIVYLLRPTTTPVEILPALSQTIPAVIAGTAAYFATLYIIDKNLRELFRAILENII